MLLVSCAAEDYQYDPADDALELDSSGQPIFDLVDQAKAESEINDTEEQEQMEEEQPLPVSDYSSLYDSYSQIPNVPETTSLALPVSDLDGDKAADLLVMNISGQAETEDFNSSISALSGADGSVLWQKDYPGSLVYAMTAGDLNGDDRTDVMVDQVLAGQELSLSSSVSVFDGSNGDEIWSRPQTMAMTVA